MMTAIYMSINTVSVTSVSGTGQIVRTLELDRETVTRSTSCALDR